MQLEKIVSLANKKSEVPFLAMVRSLRAAGCDLPVWVIPYDSETFELPENCFWWEMAEILNWVDDNNIWPAFKKIQCLTIANYQYVDSDVIFLKDPALTLEPYEGFITSCTHWNNPVHTYTPETLVFLKRKCTTWPKLVFNSGQWACDRKLYDVQQLVTFCEHQYTDTLFKKTQLYKDQAGINLLVNYKNIPISNLTLPPVNMESTWAGDYLDEDAFHYFETHDKPYLVHWAGTPIRHDLYINKYFFTFLTPQERLAYSLNNQEKASYADLLRKPFRRTYNLIKGL
jgi:hypothetical protein